MKKIKFELLFIILFVISRLPSLGHDNFTTDTWKWKSRSYDFGSGVFQMDFQKTLQKYHPGVTLMWLGVGGIKVYNFSYNLQYKTDPPDNNISTVFQLDFVQKLFVVIAVGISLAFVLYPLRVIFGIAFACLAGLLMAFEPYFVALTRVFHLEGLLSVFMLGSVVWLYWFLQYGGRRKLIISAVFAGLSILTKTTALFLVPFALMMLTAKNITDAGLVQKVLSSVSGKLGFALLLKNILSNFILWLLIASLVIFSLWPALWVDAAGVYKAIYKGIAVVGIEQEHIQYYFGRLVEDPGPTFYPVVFAFRSSVLLMFGLAGLLLVSRKFTTDRKQFILYLLCYSLLYLLALSLPTKKLDRYIVPSIVSLSVISAFFYLWFWEKIKINSIVKFFIMTLAVLTQIVYLHPDYLSYYNPLLGGLKKGVAVLEPKWLIGEREIVDYFRNVQATGGYEKSFDSSIEGLIKTKKINNVMVVAFQEKYYTQIWPFFREIGAWAVIEDLSVQSQHAQYFVYPVWEDTGKQETGFSLEYETGIYVRGTEVYRVYRKV
jgi:hypothetical protein